MEQYDRLKAELPEMAALVGKLPEALQARAFEVLIEEFRGGAAPRSTTGKGQGAENRDRGVQRGDNEIPGVALFEAEEVKFTIRDPKAESAADAVRRLAYVAIRATQLLTGEEKVSSRNIVVPLLRDFRVYNGNARGTLSKERGITRDGDLLSLDTPATHQADDYIKAIQDVEVVGKWKPGSRRRAGKKGSDAGEESDDQHDEES